MYRRRAKVDVMPTNPQKNYQGGGITLEVSDVTFCVDDGDYTPWLLLNS